MVVFLGILAFFGWTGFALVVCVIAAGASRGIAEAERKIEQARDDRRKAFGRGHFDV